MGNGGGASTVAIVENTDIKVNVMEAIYDNKYSPDVARGTGCIYWKSDWGAQHDNGTVNSPATIFDYEADHALEHKINAQEYEVNRVRGSPAVSDKRRKTSDNRFRTENFKG